MKRQYQIEQQRAVQQFRRLATEENPDIQMILPMADIVGLLQQGVGHLLRQAGLELMNLVKDEEVRALAGERHQQHEGRRDPAGVKRTATVWWMDRKYRSRKRGCGPKRNANNACIGYSSNPPAPPETIRANVATARFSV